MPPLFPAAVNPIAESIMPGTVQYGLIINDTFFQPGQRRDYFKGRPGRIFSLDGTV
jgi:hypothetical protein